MRHKDSVSQSSSKRSRNYEPTQKDSGDMDGISQSSDRYTPHFPDTEDLGKGSMTLSSVITTTASTRNCWSFARVALNLLVLE